MARHADALDERLKAKGIELIAPHRSGRVKAKTQDGRPWQHYGRRWKVEHTIAWLLAFKQVLLMWDRSIDHSLLTLRGAYF
jgi:hypothetical protein